MTPDGLEVRVDELAAQVIKGRAKSEVASMLAEKIVEKYGDDFKKEVAQSITFDEVRSRVLNEIVAEIVEKWRRDG